VTTPLRLLFVSTPVGPLGSGLGGGVELTLLNLAEELSRRGHLVRVVAPEGSVAGALPVVGLAGFPQTPAQTRNRAAPIVIPDGSVLAAMWDHARRVQEDHDLLVNFAYDWLPFYLTPFLARPVAHLVSMASLGDATDRVIAGVAARFPGTVGAYTRAQATTFPGGQTWPCIGSGVDLSRYAFQPMPEARLVWAGRIAPEKGLEDAVAAASEAGLPLTILGRIQDQAYWAAVRRAHPDAPIDYAGFLATDGLQRELGRARALLMTPRWLEAFGNVAIEALACGVPVIAYRRGGPGEIVDDGRTGWLVEPDSITGLVEATGRLDRLDRAACRAEAEARYSLPALGDRAEAWLTSILSR